jgi:Na+/proline symporter
MAQFHAARTSRMGYRGVGGNYWPPGRRGFPKWMASPGIERFVISNLESLAGGLAKALEQQMKTGRPGKLFALMLAVILAGTAVITTAYASGGTSASDTPFPANPTILIGVVVLLIATLGIGLWVSRKVKGNSVNYIVAGRSLILPLAAATLMAQSLDANATLGNTDLTAAFGFWAGASLPIGLALCLFLTGLFFAKPLNRLNLMTIADFFKLKYGRTTEIVASVIMALSFAILLGGNLVAGGFLFNAFLGTTYTQGVLIIAVVVLIYTIAGGLYAVAYTDILQVVVAFFGSMITIAFVAVKFGLVIPEGLGPFAFGQLTDPALGAQINWATLLALGLGDIVAIDFMERVFAARNPETARRACYIGAAGTLIIGVPFSFVALSGTHVLEAAGVALVAGQPILYTMLGGVFPVFLAAIVLAGIVAASMSTGDGAILGTSAVIARNIFGMRGGATAGGGDKLLRWTRLFAIPIALLGIFFALKVPQTGILLVLAFDVTFASLLVPMTLGLFWSKANTAAALTGIIAGASSRLIMFALTPQVYGSDNTILYLPNSTIFGNLVDGISTFDGLPTLISPIICLAAYAAVAYATQRSSARMPLVVPQAAD